MSKLATIPQYAPAEGGGTLADDRAMEEERARVYLYPGQVHATATPTRITTILGSCIAVCLFDPVRRVGGMNHFMLPQFAGVGASSARFGNIAMEELFARLTAAGARIPLMSARIFGGSSMFAATTATDHLGIKNERLAREALAARRVRVIESDTGGPRGRKLIFHTDEGTAWLTSI